MAKDPATLFYWNDWHSGTVTLSRFQKGCYMDLLHAQFNNGHLSLEEIKTVLGSDFGSSWPALQKKFQTDDKGLYFNERLLTESVKRKSYTKSRRQNAAKTSEHMLQHMENENEDINGTVIKLTTTAREIFFNDLPNSQGLETIAMDLKMSKEDILGRLDEFRAAAEVDYPAFKDFCRHLKNWIKKNPAKSNERRLVR